MSGEGHTAWLRYLSGGGKKKTKEKNCFTTQAHLISTEAYSRHMKLCLYRTGIYTTGVLHLHTSLRTTQVHPTHKHKKNKLLNFQARAYLPRHRVSYQSHKKTGLHLASPQSHTQTPRSLTQGTREFSLLCST